MMLKASQKLRNDSITPPAVETTNPLTVNDKSSPLLALPLELREKIYGWVQGGPHIKLTTPPDWKPRQQFAGNVLLHLNKHIFAEYTNLILATGDIVLDFQSHDSTPREVEILRTAHKLQIRCEIPPVCGSKGYTSSHPGCAPVLPKHPERNLQPWVEELVQNSAILQLKVIVAQSVLYRCKDHGEENEKGECCHVKTLRKATKQLREVAVRGPVEVLWDWHGWGTGQVCFERVESWLAGLKRKIRQNGKKVVV